MTVHMELTFSKLLDVQIFPWYPPRNCILHYILRYSTYNYLSTEMHITLYPGKHYSRTFDRMLAFRIPTIFFYQVIRPSVILADDKNMKSDTFTN